MRAVVQRVSRAQVTVAGEITCKIGLGLLVLLGVAGTDTGTVYECIDLRMDTQLLLFENNQPVFEDCDFNAGFDNVLLHCLPCGVAGFCHLSHLLQQFLIPVNQINGLINIKELIIPFLELSDEPELRGTNRLRLAVRFLLGDAALQSPFPRKRNFLRDLNTDIAGGIHAQTRSGIRPPVAYPARGNAVALV